MSTILSLARLFRSVGSVHGRKRLQKIVHLLQASAKLDFGVTFSLCHYGAFSTGLARELDSLTDFKLISVRPLNAGSFPSQSYSADPRLEAFVQNTCRPEEDLPWAPLAQEFAEMPMPLLEALSTVVYLRQAGWSADSLQEQFQALKPHLTSHFDEAMKRSHALVASP